jgi:RNA polymerase sigma-70 factor (ECF subfamily)
MSAVQPDNEEMGQTPVPLRSDETVLIESLRCGDEIAFTALLDEHYAAMVRFARIYVRDRAVAEEVVQETWEAVVKGIDRFKAQSSLKTWIFRILTFRAQTHARGENRSIPFSTYWSPDTDSQERAVEPERFHITGRWPGHWVSLPQNWDELPEDRVLSRETYAYIQQAIEALPPQQREVITLRDVEGWTVAEVCDLLGVTDVNQRVLLHRARSRVRRALEQLLKEE